MPELLRDYLPIVIFMGVALGLSLVLLITPILIAIRNPDPEKLSAYECGFNAFDDARMKFDVRFYLVSILFIIFDLEVAFLFPWAVSLKEVGVFGFLRSTEGLSSQDSEPMINTESPLDSILLITFV